MARTPYEVDRTTTLRLDAPHEGVEIDVRASLDTATYFAAARLSERLTANAVSDDEAMAVVEELTGILSGYLVDWNLSRLGQPVSVSVAGVQSLDLTLRLAIIKAWLGEVARPLAAAPVPSNRQQRRSTGRRSTAASSRVNSTAKTPVGSS